MMTVPPGVIEPAMAETLVGLEVASISVWTAQLSILFTGRKSGLGIDSRLDIESGFRLRHNSEVLTVLQSDGLKAFRMHAGAALRLIGQTVKKAEPEGNELELTFSDGDEFRILVPDDGFEAYHLVILEQTRPGARR
jgi:hypothetical protein